MEGRNLVMSYNQLNNLVKASGLRSKKSRHRKKRIKKIVYKALLRGIEKHGSR
jgi:hypothetical protein